MQYYTMEDYIDLLVYVNHSIKNRMATLTGNNEKLSSTTGNVYGIYDMSGGTWEYVMGVYGTSSPTTGSSGFDTFPDSKYYNLYSLHFSGRSLLIIL